jgi:hypothetical protein
VRQESSGAPRRWPVVEHFKSEVFMCMQVSRRLALPTSLATASQSLTSHCY